MEIGWRGDESGDTRQDGGGDERQDGWKMWGMWEDVWMKEFVDGRECGLE